MNEYTTWRRTDDDRVEVEVNQDGTPIRVRVRGKLSEIRDLTYLRSATLAVATDHAHIVLTNSAELWVPVLRGEGPHYERKVVLSDVGGLGHEITNLLIERNIVQTKLENAEEENRELEEKLEELRQKNEELVDRNDFNAVAGDVWDELRRSGVLDALPWSALGTVEQTRFEDALKTARNG